MSARKMACMFVVALQLVCRQAAHGQSAPASHGGMDMDRVIRTYVLANQLEIRGNVAERPVNFEVLSWIGGDYNRVFLRAQGLQPTTTREGTDVQADVFLGRLISPYWSAVVGGRVDTRPRSVARSAQPAATDASGSDRRQVTRGMFALGFVGLAPGWFELEPTLFVSQDGDVSTEIESSIDLLLTQRLIIQPRLEVNAAVQSVPTFGIGAGINDVEFEARLRYEIKRKFAPYVGVSWLRRTSGTAAMARAAGEPLGVGAVTAGVRLWR